MTRAMDLARAIVARRKMPSPTVPVLEAKVSSGGDDVTVRLPIQLALSVESLTIQANQVALSVENQTVNVAPAIDVTVPEIKLPEIVMPEINIPPTVVNVPAPVVNIKLPKSEEKPKRSFRIAHDDGTTSTVSEE